MKPTLILTTLLVTCFLFITSCNSNNKNNPESPTAEDLSKAVTNWNNAHNSKDISVFTNLYADSILYYGILKDKNTCIQSKLAMFKKYPGYGQQILGTIQKENINDTDIKYSFVKRVTINQHSKDYPSYIIFSKKQGVWKIINEGDSVTDKNLAKAKEIYNPTDTITGDFNGDGVLDSAWLVPPERQDCEPGCTAYIQFSDKNIPPIKVEDCISGTPNNLGDLNKNGGDEIGLLPGWCTSCWRNYNVYTLKNGKWIFAVQPFSTHCNQWEDGVIPIEIDSNKQGNVIIRYMELGDTSFAVKTKSVPIIK